MECGDLSPLFDLETAVMKKNWASTPILQKLTQKRRQVAALHTKPVGALATDKSGSVACCPGQHLA
jgi:hypothetical protein